MFNVAIVGVTGAVGGVMLQVLEERGFPVTRLVPLASARTAAAFANCAWFSATPAAAWARLT